MVRLKTIIMQLLCAVRNFLRFSNCAVRRALRRDFLYYEKSKRKYENFELFRFIARDWILERWAHFKGLIGNCKFYTPNYIIK